MGLLTELLYPTLNKSTVKTKASAAETTKEEKQSDKVMSAPVSIITLDGNAPNGGVSPGNILVEIPKAQVDPPNGGPPLPVSLDQGTSPLPVHRSSTTLHITTS